MPELTAESTHEDITAAVEDIIQSRSEPEKTDGQAIAEERDKVEGTVETKSDEGEEAAEEGEDSAEDERAWLDDSLKAEVSAYGIDEKELADFTSREEVERAMRMFDRTALEAGRKAMKEQDETPQRDEKGKFTKNEPEPTIKEGRYEIALDKDVYDEGLVAELTRMRDHYEERIATLETRFAEADSRAEEERFDNLVDTLGHADLFGKSGKETTKELERRQNLFVQVKALQVGLQQLGRPVEFDQSLVNRVAKMVFAEEFVKKELKSRTRKIADQANGRMGGGATRSSDPKETLREEFRRIYKEKENAG